MNQNPSNLTAKIVGGFIISAVLVIGVYTLLIKKSDTNAVASTTTSTVTSTTTASATPSATPTTSVTPTPSATSTPTPTPTPSTIPTSGYKDGTYKATVSYFVPHDQNSMTATITIANGEITGVSTTNQYGDHESASYINDFKSSISNAVVGKKIDKASVGRVGGASLTSEAFNEALDQVMNQAKS